MFQPRRGVDICMCLAPEAFAVCCLFVRLCVVLCGFLVLCVFVASVDCFRGCLAQATSA